MERTLCGCSNLLNVIYELNVIPPTLNDGEYGPLILSTFQLDHPFSNIGYQAAKC